MTWPRIGTRASIFHTTDYKLAQRDIACRPLSSLEHTTSVNPAWYLSASFSLASHLPTQSPTRSFKGVTLWSSGPCNRHVGTEKALIQRLSCSLPLLPLFPKVCVRPPEEFCRLKAVKRLSHLEASAQALKTVMLPLERHRAAFWDSSAVATA